MRASLSLGKENLRRTASIALPPRKSKLRLVSRQPRVEIENFGLADLKPTEGGVEGVQQVVELAESHGTRDAHRGMAGGREPLLPKIPRRFGGGHVAPLGWYALGDEDQRGIELHRDQYPLRMSEQGFIGDIRQNLQGRERTAFGNVNDSRPGSIPTTGIKGRAVAVKGPGSPFPLTQAPSRDHANTPCSRRPRSCSTSRAPGSVATSASGVWPPRAFKGCESH